MLALRFDHYGSADGLSVVECAEPVPRAGELKIRVRAGSLNPLDWKLRQGHLKWAPGFARPPRGTGVDFAGEIVGVGGDTAGHWVGQRVFGALSPFRRDGALAQFVCAEPRQVAAIPDGIDFDVAAALPTAAGAAVQALDDHVALQPGLQVAITGAAGGVGHFAVQLARHRGAMVTGICGPANSAFVSALGADRVVDYTAEDFRRGEHRFDVVFDAACSTDYWSCRQVLAAGGTYLNTSGSFGAAAGTFAAALAARVFAQQRAVPIALASGSPMWNRLARLAAEGVLVPHIAARIAFDEVRAAQREMEGGHGRGKIVVAIP